MASSYIPTATKYEWSGIDLRREFDIILAQHGHKIYLRRADKARRCVCWDNDTSSKHPKCEICSEDGWIFTEETHLARSRTAMVTRGAARAEAQIDPGYIDTTARVYYLRYTVVPHVADEIIEKDDNGEIYEMWDIENAEPKRDKFGRIEYYTCVCSKIDFGKARKALNRTSGQSDGRL